LAVLYTLAMVGSITGGWFPMYFIKKGYKAYDGRMKAMLLIAIIPLVVLLAQPFGYISYWVPVILIGIGTSAHQAWSANIFTTVSDMFPKKAIGSVVGIGGMAGAIGGLFIATVVGHVLQWTGSYRVPFLIAGSAYLLALAIIHALVPRLEPAKISAEMQT